MCTCELCKEDEDTNKDMPARLRKVNIPFQQGGGRGDDSGAQRCVLKWLKYLQIDLHISAVVVAASRSSFDFVFT